MDEFARMTVSGVFRSCDASAMNWRCDSQASLTGFSAHFDSASAMRKNTASVAMPAIASVSASDFQLSVVLVSANAMYVVSSTVRFW